jgi:hypothetical protein
VTVPSSRADRRRSRQPTVLDLFGEDVEAAQDILELTEFAWHDCYDEITPPDAVLDDIYVCSRGSLAELARAARLAVTDFRDVRLWAEDLRSR